MSKRSLLLLEDFNGAGVYYAPRQSTRERKPRRVLAEVPVAVLHVGHSDASAATLADPPSTAGFAGDALELLPGHDACDVGASGALATQHSATQYPATPPAKAPQGWPLAWGGAAAVALFGSGGALGSSQHREISGIDSVKENTVLPPLCTRAIHGSDGGMTLASLFDEHSFDSLCNPLGIADAPSRTDPAPDESDPGVGGASAAEPPALPTSCAICLMPTVSEAGAASGGGATAASLCILENDSGCDGSVLLMPCCGSAVHAACLGRCVQMRAIRKNCCACQVPFDAAVHERLAAAEAASTAARRQGRLRLSAALAVGLESLLQVDDLLPR